jgi:hypothetical protein
MAVLGLNAAPFKSGLHDSALAAKNFGRHVTESLTEVAAGAFAGFGAASLIEGLIETTERVHQLSREFRVSTDTIQIWEKAAHRVGLSAEDIGNALNKLKKAREAAIAKGEVGGFGAFGIGMAELKDGAIETEGIMDRMRANASAHPITDQEDVAGMELMGRSGAKVLSAMQEIHEMGPIKVISKEQVEQLHEATEQLADTRTRLRLVCESCGKIRRVRQVGVNREDESRKRLFNDDGQKPKRKG